MADPLCFSSLQVCRLRVARLSAAGAPSVGATNGYTSDGLVSVALTFVLSEGDDFEQKNGCGDICATFVDCDKVKRVDSVVTLCTLDAQLIDIMAGGTVFVETPSNDQFGMKIPSPGDACENPVSLEWWTIAWDVDTQATPASLSQSPAYWHFVIPKNRFVFGDITFENGIAVIPLNGKGEANQNITSNGPFNDWPSEVAGTGGIDSPFGFWLDATLPTAACDPISVPSGS